jgi:hypothetical protein
MPSEVASDCNSRPPKRLRVSSTRCTFCGRPFDSWGRCLRRCCPGYVRTWEGDQQRVLRDNLGCFADGTGKVLFCTLTPPGDRRLPWDKSRCEVRRPHACRGELGCRVVPGPARTFNRSAQYAFSDVHRAASARATRSTGMKPWLLARVWELQKRGLLHVHLVVAAGTKIQRACASAYYRALAELAATHGFGFTSRQIQSPEWAAHYCGKDLARTARSPDAPRRIVHVSRALLRETGSTVRACRQRRADYRAREG